METPIPFLLYGDGPRLSTGLARIARDLALRLEAHSGELGIAFSQVGVDYPGGRHWQSWDFWGFQPNPQDQGRQLVGQIVDTLTQESGGRKPIVLMIMDPARCYDLLRTVERENPEGGVLAEAIPADFWGYYPLDATNRNGLIGGPAGRAICDTDRLLGYGRWGAGVLKATLTHAAQQSSITSGNAVAVKRVSYLPHGLDLHAFKPGIPLEQADHGFQDWARTVPPEVLKIGCVATNQPRKDLSLLFQAGAALRAQGVSVALWLHTDKMTAAWDIGELVSTCGLHREQVAASCDEITDQQLAARYGWSDVTLAPGLGEGFGYPIVESLACGTPVVHGEYAGGVELIPRDDWTVPAVAWRLESVYALRRPVFDPQMIARYLEAAGTERREHPARTAAYCSGAVAHLNWRYLWPRWQAWITQGLKEYRHDRSSKPTPREPVQALQRAGAPPPDDPGEQREAL